MGKEPKRRADADVDGAAPVNDCSGPHHLLGGETGYERQREHPDDVVAALDGRQRAGQGEGEGRAQIEEHGKVEAAVEHGG